VFASPTATVARDSAGRVTVRATRIPEPITLDGALDEGVYLHIQPIDGFLQQEPHEGQPATQRTEVWLLFDDKNIYVTARCWSTDPSRIVANEMRRDSFANFQNDNFVLFDTFRPAQRRSSSPAVEPGDSLSPTSATETATGNTGRACQRFEQGRIVEFAIPPSRPHPAGARTGAVQARGGANDSHLAMPACSRARALRRRRRVGLEASRPRSTSRPTPGRVTDPRPPQPRTSNGQLE
jgi:hypothetical protein